MSLEEYGLLSTEDKIANACLFEPVAWREMKPRWFFIVYKVEDFFVELKFDEFNTDRLAIDARSFLSDDFLFYISHNFYSPYTSQYI